MTVIRAFPKPLPPSAHQRQIDEGIEDCNPLAILSAVVNRIIDHKQASGSALKSYTEAASALDLKSREHAMRVVQQELRCAQVLAATIEHELIKRNNRPESS